MNNLKKQQDEGFTIIEVVLVLAIAALIMLMVFIALPALQRNQRDTARKNDISRLQSAINNSKGRNRGDLPDFNAAFVNELKVGGDEFADPVGGEYEFRNMTSITQETYSEDDAKLIYIYQGAKCDGEDPAGSIRSSARNVAIVKPLESGGRHCQEA